MVPLYQVQQLNVPVSLYNGVKDNAGTVVPLSLFLSSKRHIGTIEALRHESDPEKRKRIKLSLPQATVSGVFSPSRRVDNLKSHSGLICIDLDGKQNEGHSLSYMRGVLESRKDVLFASLSVGGNGLFAIVPLAYPDKQKEQFYALRSEFKQRYDLVLDNCGDVTRLRVLSFDPDAYVNGDAVKYDGIERQAVRIQTHSLSCTSEDIQKVARCVEQIVANRIDITASYEDWISVGMSLCSLGEEGRYYFHMVSRQNEKYKYSESDRMFSYWMKNMKQVGIGTFFFLCSQYGITYKSKQT